MKILVSWIAKQHDFKQGAVNDDGPTLSFYQHFFDHDLHVLLSQELNEDLLMDHLASRLRVLYPQHKDKLQPRLLGVSDVIDIAEIKSKVEALLLEFRGEQVDIFYSPGTSAMQVAWYICHSTLGLNTRLLQTRPAHKSKSRKPELLHIDVEFSTVPRSAVIHAGQVRGAGTSKPGHLLVPSIREVYDRAAKIAAAEGITTLITGNSGTGKEQLARHIHERSARAAFSFLPVNCSAFNDQLLEARLFGYKKGAFTGADKDTPGLFEAARGGTLFLDEIGDISPYLQQSLLRVLQEQEILPLGSNTPLKTNVRVIAATNKQLPDACEQEKFRWDLYYRLTVTELFLPELAAFPMEERRAMIDHFLQQKKQQFDRRKALSLTREAYQALLNYPFPGNIREMENLIEQLYVFHDTEVKLEGLPPKITRPPLRYSLKWSDVERLHIEKVLRMAGGNKSRALKWLAYGSPNTLQKKLREYGIEPGAE